MARRSALLIGCDQYQSPSFPPLITPVSDVRELAKLLADPHVGRFNDVTVVPSDHNAPAHSEVRAAIETFFRRRQPEDTLLLYVACHGRQDAEGELFFAMHDTRVDLLQSTGVSSDWVAARIRNSRAHRILTMLDCCYSGAFRSRGEDKIPALLPAEGEGRLVITSSRATQQAYEPADATSGVPMRSNFIDAVLTGIDSGAADADGDGVISADELYNYVHLKMQPVRRLQEPVLEGRRAGHIWVAWRRPQPVQNVSVGSVGLPKVPAQRRQIEPSWVRIIPITVPGATRRSATYTVKRWLHRVGSTVEQGTPLVEVESGGVPSEIEAPTAGVLRGLVALEGEMVEAGATVGIIVVGGLHSVLQQRRVVARKAQRLRTATVALPPIAGSAHATVTYWWAQVGDRVVPNDPLLQIEGNNIELDVLSPCSTWCCSVFLKSRLGPDHHDRS
jgi:Caspase domain/Biotin-requiring enzyme